ncbi:MAG: hypothetical protein IKO19_00070 [Candidatus Riflebacteria bacterium]|nr:hypothetical protein [Candidatus Riflebacteria bacterium]
MRFIKPKKGFRLSRNLGLLLFSTAVISGSLSTDNKAYGLEAPSMPPSVLMASAKNTDSNSSSKAVKPSEKKDVKAEKTLTSKEVKPVPASAASVKSNTEKSVKEVEVVPAPVVKQNSVEEKSEELTPAAPPSLLVNSVKNQNTKQFDEDEDDIADDEFSIKGEDQPKPSSNLIASAKIVEKDVAPAVAPKSAKEKAPAPLEKKAEVKPVEKKEAQAKAVAEAAVVKKAEVKTAEKKISDNSAKKEIVKSSSKASDKAVEVKKAEKTEVKEETKPEVKKHSKVRRVSKKITVDDNECPPEWDWFSKPLVFVRDANGKLVITADKNAPDIVIGSKKTSGNDIKSVKAVKAEKKVVQVKKPVKKAEPKKEEYVEAKSIEAPAAPAVVVEPKPVVEETAEVKEETPVVSYAKPVVMIETKNAEETKPLFAEASEKMARIKRLHAYEAKYSDIEMASVRRSASMIRMHKLVVELIKRTENKPNKANKMMKASVAPQAPPKAANNSKIADSSSDSRSDSSNTSKYAFRPYVNPNFSSTMYSRAY